MNSFEFGQAVGFWAIPVLLAIWVIIKIAVKFEKRDESDGKGKSERKAQPKEINKKESSNDYHDDEL